MYKVSIAWLKYLFVKLRNNATIYLILIVYKINAFIVDKATGARSNDLENLREECLQHGETISKMPNMYQFS
jgi:hypothetical protein